MVMNVLQKGEGEGERERGEKIRKSVNITCYFSLPSVVRDVLFV